MKKKLETYLETEPYQIQVENLILKKILKNTVWKTLIVIINLIEAKDKYTKGHSKRVAKYSLGIAEALGLNTYQKTSLTKAALLHDVGKIGIPDAILLKPAPLTKEEFAFIQKHPEIGYHVFSSYQELLEERETVLYHHERWDGSGYPKGLKGKDIPLFARIIAVADSYDAITSQRVYNKQKTPKEALAEIKKLAGQKYDPEIVEAFEDFLSFFSKKSHSESLSDEENKLLILLSKI